MDILRRLFHVMRTNVTTAEHPNLRSAGGADYDRYRSPNEHQGPPPQPVVDPQIASYYANLELAYGAGRDDVRAAWKRLMKKYHPDLHAADPEKRRIANELTAELTNAYQHLDSALESAAV